MHRLLAVVVAFAVVARTAHAEDRVQVAVLRFLPRKEAPEHVWVGTGLAHLVGSDLASRAGFAVVEHGQVAALLRELRLVESGVAGRSEASRVAGIAGADWAVLGTYELTDGVVDAEVTCVDAKTGAIVHSGRAKAPLSALGALSRSLADAVVTGEATEPFARSDTPAIEALAAYYGAVAAEERGDEAAAFVGYAGALERPDAPPDAAVDLGRLYARMGEPEHAVAEWRRVIEVTKDPRRAMLAARLAARALDRDLGRPVEAGAVLAAMLERYADLPEAVTIARLTAELMADGGDVHGALEFLRRARDLADRRAKEQLARLTPTQPSGVRGHAEMGWLIARRGRATGSVWELESSIAEVFVDAYRRAPHDEPAPDGVVRVGADRTPVRIAGQPPPPPDAAMAPTWIGGRVLLAPRGTLIARVHLHARARRARATAASAVRFEAGEDGSLSLLQRQSARPGDAWAPMELASGPRRPARVVRAHAVGENVTVEEATLTVDLVPEVESAPAGRGTGVVLAAGPLRVKGPSAAQHARISSDAEGRVHVVFADGDFVWFEGYGISSTPTRDPDLWIATSEDAGASFGLPRRLTISTDSTEICPSLLQGRDGLHRLVWVSDRVERGRADLWISTSRDLKDWTYPRRVRLPSLGRGGTLFSFTAGTSLEVAAPRLVEDARGTLHLFVRLAAGARGLGVYVLTSTDGVAWSEPALVTLGMSRFAVAPLGGAGFVLAARRHRTGATALHLTEDGRSWRRMDVRHAGAAEGSWFTVGTALLVRGREVFVWDAMSPERRGLFRSRLGEDSGPPIATLDDADVEDAMALPDGTILSLIAPSSFAGDDGLRVLRTEAPR